MGQQPGRSFGVCGASTYIGAWEHRAHLSVPPDWPGVFFNNVQENKYPPTRHIHKRKEGLDRDIYYLVLHSIHSK